MEDGWDWAHLALTCLHTEVALAREAYLEPAIWYLHGTDRRTAFYKCWPNVPTPLQGLPLQQLQMGGVPDALAWASAIYLAGGCLTDPREATWSFSFGQCDFITTGLKHFSYVYLASFLKSVAPLFVKALGDSDRDWTGSNPGDSDSSQVRVVTSPRIDQGELITGDGDGSEEAQNHTVVRPDSPT